ncbi:hypothetical protein LMOIWNZ_00064 [Enterococcus phage vB_OCPT_CCS3]|nr:hypothetical protein LMOIWNZ_00064 [Enterococcus phage vB_OCPT_CCS3]
MFLGRIYYLYNEDGTLFFITKRKYVATLKKITGMPFSNTSFEDFSNEVLFNYGDDIFGFDVFLSLDGIQCLDIPVDNILDMQWLSAKPHRKPFEALRARDDMFK